MPSYKCILFLPFFLYLHDLDETNFDIGQR